MATVTLRPNAAGTWQGYDTASPTHWGATSDESDTTYLIYTAGESAGIFETENLADTAQTGTISNVTVYMRAKVAAGASGAVEKAATYIITHSAEYAGTSTTISRTTITDYSTSYDTNPNTTAAWTWDEVNALEVGSKVTQIATGESIWFYEYWIVVTYTVVTGPPPAVLVQVCGSSDQNGSEPEELAILRKYGAATTINFSLYELDGTDLKTDAADGGADCIIMKNEGPEGTCTNDFVDEGNGYSLALTATEMEAARIVIYVIDQTNPKVWLDRVINIETYGNASAQHPFDLATATVNLSSTTETQIDNIEGYVDTEIGDIHTDLATLQTMVTDIHNTDLPAVKTDTGAIHTVIDDLHDTDVPDLHTDIGDIHTDVGTVAGYVDTEVASILAAVDTEVAAIKAVTDTLTLAGIADAVLDEVIDAAAPANADSLRETINVIASAVAGKLGGGGTGTLTFRDLGDTKPRITATVDAAYNRTAVTQDGT